jgi:chemotaxis protein methyltransferase CheR
MSDVLGADLLAELSTFVAHRMGLHFPSERWQDLARGAMSAAREHGPQDARAYVQRLLTVPLTRREIETLAGHLTVGETYFFRERQSFDILRECVLPALIERRRGVDKRLRIWSAGCCTGEEPYSLAILLDSLIPDIAEWNVTILATDINPRFLEIASSGAFGEWSFRAIPHGIRERYFFPLPGGKMQIAPRIRRLVTFDFLNLAEDSYPSLVNNTSAMDLVLCRNVLMYFTPETTARVVSNMHRALVNEGWLLVAPSESSQVLFRDYTMFAFPDTIFYQKPAAPAPFVVLPALQAHASAPQLPTEQPEPEPPRSSPEAASELQAESPVLRAQELADQGRLAEARTVCNRAIELDPVNPAYRFLRAMVEQELGRLDDAMKSLEQALYLDQAFVMAHFALGNLGRRLGRHAVSRRHFRSALGLVHALQPETLLPESGGLSAGRLGEFILMMMEEEGETQ